MLSALDGASLASHDDQRAALEALKGALAVIPISTTRKDTARIWIDHVIRQVDRHAERLDPYLGLLPIKGVVDVDGVLADLPATSLDWHMRETLGLASYRLDAWLTSLATRRLREVMGTGTAGSRCQFGGYGFVLDLKPDTKGESDGFLHAPTMAQATTGAILRSGMAARMLRARSRSICRPNGCACPSGSRARRARMLGRFT